MPDVRYKKRRVKISVGVVSHSSGGVGIIVSKASDVRAAAVVEVV